MSKLQLDRDEKVIKKNMQLPGFYDEILKKNLFANSCDK